VEAITVPVEQTTLPIDLNEEIVIPARVNHRRSYPSKGRRREFDWSSFWLLEVLILGLPLLVAVFCLPEGAHLSFLKMELLAGLQLILTVFNFIWVRSRALRWKHRHLR